MKGTSLDGDVLDLFGNELSPGPQADVLCLDEHLHVAQRLSLLFRLAFRTIVFVMN